MRFEITSPCDEPWDAMTPRDGGRYCDRCEKVVIDLSVLSRAQAEQKIRAVQAPEVCVRLAFDRLGDVVFQKPPPARAPHWARGLVLASALTAASACTEPEPPCSAKATALVADPGPPMMPSDATLASVVAPPERTTGPVSPDELDADHDATPTAEQRRLTAAKHRPPPVYHMAGAMPIQHYYGGPPF